MTDTKQPEAAGLPALPPAVATIHDDGYWTSVFPKSQELQLNFGKKEVFTAEQMHAYARLHAAEVARRNAADTARLDWLDSYAATQAPASSLRTWLWSRPFGSGNLRKMIDADMLAALSAEPGEKP